MPRELQAPAVMTDTCNELDEKAIAKFGTALFPYNNKRRPLVSCNKRARDDAGDTYVCNLAAHQRAGYEVYILDPFESDPEVRQQSCSQ